MLRLFPTPMRIIKKHLFSGGLEMSGITKNRIWSWMSLFMVCCLVFVGTAQAATQVEIDQAINDGIAWLAAQQDSTSGCWSSDVYQNGATGLALTKLQERAFELGYESPFDPCYPYEANVIKGLNYLFSNAKVVEISTQPAGDPDSDHDGNGVYIGSYYNYNTKVYDTGIALMAIVSSRAPNRIVHVPGSQVDNWTYKQVVDDMVDWLAFAQYDNTYGRGGWAYGPNVPFPDNSVSGYAVLGLAYAQSNLYGFNCTIPQFVKNELNFWIISIQSPDGGSGYECSGTSNILRTGNLIFEATFYGDPTSTKRIQTALEYLNDTWNNANRYTGWGKPGYCTTGPHYQAMYCVMKAMTYSGLDTVPPNKNWYDEFADAIVNTQEEGAGSWPVDAYGNDKALSTAWALLTLERSSPQFKTNEVKWSQPPSLMGVYTGWDEESHNLLPRMVADDFLCDSNNPVSAIRWWGSFIGWKDSNIPPNLPDRFYFTIWDDVPAGVLDPNDPNDPNGYNPYSHPGHIVWRHYCNNYTVNFYGWEFDPHTNQIEHSKFQFYQELEPNDYWHQPNDNAIYWLGIMAIYDDNEPNNLWGWETRKHYFQDDAVRFFHYPDANQSYDINDFEPIEFAGKSWDMSFQIISTSVSTPNEPQATADLGDAPDSINNNFGATMTAYTGVEAKFPTVYKGSSRGGPYGPIHRNPKARACLGHNVTFENEADKGLDQDPNNNIIPNFNIANQDCNDDGVSMPLNLPPYQRVTFDYTVNVFSKKDDLYVNVWFDWNRDGDWDDVSDYTVFGKYPVCVLVQEWAVQNQLLSNLPLELNTITTPSFWCWTTTGQPIWMRITLSEQPWDPDVMGSGGAGPESGYLYGETEDYYFVPDANAATDPDIIRDGRIDFKDLAALAAHWLEYRDPNGP
jgi:hypothetical protein